MDVQEEHSARVRALRLHNATRMEFRYDFGAKLFVAILLLLVISDQLTSPSPDPRDAAPPQPSAERKLLEPAGGVDMRRRRRV